MGGLIERITDAFEVIRELLPPDMVLVMEQRVLTNKALLLGADQPKEQSMRRTTS